MARQILTKTMAVYFETFSHQTFGETEFYCSPMTYNRHKLCLFIKKDELCIVLDKSLNSPSYAALVMDPEYWFAYSEYPKPVLKSKFTIFKNDLRVISGVFPREVDFFKQNFSAKNNAEDIRLTLALVCLRGKSFNLNFYKEGEYKAEIDFRLWNVLLIVYNNSTDPARKILLDEWNKALKNEEDGLYAQIRALEFDWNKDFLTDDFWSAINETTQKRVLNTAKKTLEKHGSKADLKKTKQNNREKERRFNAITLIATNQIFITS